MEKFQELSVLVWTEELGCQSSNQNDCDWLNNKEWVNAGKEWDKVTVEQWAIMKIITQKEQPYDKETPLLGIYLEKNIIQWYMHHYVQSSAIHNSRDMETT